MDDPGVEDGQLERSLQDLRVYNRWLGGRRTAVRLVLDLAQRVPYRPVRLLDLGTGGADIPLALVAAARGRQIDLRITATDVHPKTLEVARAATDALPKIEVHLADARSLPYEDGAFDLVTSCTMLHHFDALSAMRILGEMNRVASYGMVVTDLARSRPALAGAQLLAATLWRYHSITKHDGPVSVRAAFTPEELSVIAEEAIGPGCRIRTHPLFRLSLVVDRTRRPGLRVRGSGGSARGMGE